MDIDDMFAALGGRFDAAEVEVVNSVVRGTTARPCRMSS